MSDEACDGCDFTYRRSFDYAFSDWKHRSFDYAFSDWKHAISSTANWNDDRVVNSNIVFASESVLKKIWLSPEEDEAWKDL